MAYKDVLIACVAGLKGFPDAIEAVYPKTQVQPGIVHQMRHFLRHVGWKQRKVVAADLRSIYTAATMAEAEAAALEASSDRWDGEYPGISLGWRAN